MEKDYRLDEYYRSFKSGEYSEFLTEQKALENQSRWLSGVTTKNLTVSPLSTPMEARVVSTDPNNTMSFETLDDTSRNAGLILDCEGKRFCLRDCSIPSLKNTLGFDGPTLARMKKEDLADVYNKFFPYAREASQLLVRGEKVSAFLSMQYEYMPGSKLLDICESLQSTFGPSKFLGGTICHSMTVAEWEFPASAPMITKAYNNALLGANKNPATTSIVPVVQYRASDTSNAAAMLLTYLKIGPGQLLPLGGAYVPHIPPREYHNDGTRYTCIEKFQEESDTLFAQMGEDLDDLVPKMLATKINYPGNCFIGMAKYAGIPQKWGGRIELDLRQDFPDGSDCCFLDIYEAMSKATALAIEDGFDPRSTRILDLEEGICKIARKRTTWKRFDLPGTMAWSPKVRAVLLTLARTA